MPCKKRKPLLWIGIGLMLLIAYVGLNLFVPGPTIKVSTETTVITSPLNSKGLPQFGRHWHEARATGVTPELNAAVLIWQAVGSRDVRTADFAAICQAIGIDPIPNPPEQRVHIHFRDKQLQKTLKEWLASDTSANVPNSSEANINATEMAEQLVEQVMSRPWRGQQIPPMLKWIEENQSRLDMLLDASMRPRYYSPSPSYLNNSDTPLPSIDFPDIHDNVVRSCVRDLHTRTMWHLGEDRPMSAWADVHAGYRLSRLLSQGMTEYHLMVAYVIENMSCTATNTIFDSGRLSSEEIQTIISELDNLPQRTSIVDTIDTWERFKFVDSVLAYSHGDWIHPYLLEAGVPESLSWPSINWNEPLRIGNQWFDRLVTAAKISNPGARTLAFDTIYTDLEQFAPSGRSALFQLFSRNGRTELATIAVVHLLLPAAVSMVELEFMCMTRAKLTRTAGVLALYRAKHGIYPETLAQLVPSLLPTIPIDPYSEQPLVYERRNDGYLLYSVGKNGMDDHGVDSTGSIYDGEWLNLGELPPGGRDIHNFDLVVRMPHPEFVLPVPNAVAD
ncbi:MAG: hypothetical protein O3C60_12110 [Planctomycetota bacterium]|nr:hypothetical protein [Planctomycetota bacterium]